MRTGVMFVWYRSLDGGSCVNSGYLPGPVHRGKVRQLFAPPFASRGIYDAYNVPDPTQMLIVTSDRLMAGQKAVPGRGVLLTAIANFWLSLPSLTQALPTNVVPITPEELPAWAYDIAPRSMLVQTVVAPEVWSVFGYLVGTALDEYLACRTVGGTILPPGMTRGQQPPTGPLVMPGAGAEGATYDPTLAAVTPPDQIRSMCLRAYITAQQHAQDSGVALVGATFTLGTLDNAPVFCWPGITPDTAWMMLQEEFDVAPPITHNQMLVEWLQGTGWNGEGSPPTLPDDLVRRFIQHDHELYRRLTCSSF